MPPIPDHISAYLKRLTAAYPGIQSIWLFGSRVNPRRNHTPADWDFLVFASLDILQALRKDASFQNSNVDLLVVYDGNRFESPWPKGGEFSQGRLRNGFEKDRYVYGYLWQQKSETEATYISTRNFGNGKRLRAFRVYPE